MSFSKYSEFQTSVLQLPFPLFIQQISHQDVVLPCGTVLLEIQVAITTARLPASSPHHHLQTGAQSTGALLPSCSLLEMYSVCCAAEHPRAVAAPLTHRDGQTLAAGKHSSSLDPQVLSGCT